MPTRTGLAGAQRKADDTRPGGRRHISTSGSLVAEMMREVAINVTECRVPQTAHWVPEENASAFSRALREFLNA